MSQRTIESSRDRASLAEDAGLRLLSGVSVLAGVIAGLGAFAALLAVAAAVAAAAGQDPGSFTAHDWHTAGAAGGLVVAGLMFVSYLFGGYVGGRMARRSGAAHGLAVFVVSAVLAGGAGALVRYRADTRTLTAALHVLGIPTRWREWRQAAAVGGIGSAVAMLVGGVLGGIAGERWHGKLVRRAADPAIGPEAEARAAAAASEEEADRFHRTALALSDRGPSVTRTDEPALHVAKSSEHAPTSPT